MMRTLVVTSALLLLSSTTLIHGFAAVKPSRNRHVHGSPFLLKMSTEADHHVAFDPMAKPVDLARAKLCAEHFGQCTVDEMQELRDNLHKERMQKFMFSNYQHDTAREIEDSLEHRLLEEELDLQLSMLREQNEGLHGGPTLFPEVEEPMAELPHLKDHTHSEHDKEVIEAAELAHALEETVLEESNLEPLVVCAVIGALLAFPHLVHI